MAWLKAKDISQYQGAWKDTGEDIVMIKMSGGDAGTYYDSQATTNYYGAKNANKAVGGYHFAGGGDPIAEADFFVRAMSPLAQNDVMALDWEISHSNPVQWCLDFVNEVYAKTNTWPLIYMNFSTLNSYDWSPVLKNCGLWLADWSVSPDTYASTSHPYVMQQYADGPDYDRDAWFDTIEVFNKYGYQPQTNPAPAPTPPPADTPLTPITPTPAPVTPSPAPAQDTPGVVSPDKNPPAESPVVSPPVKVTALPYPKHWYDFILNLLRWLVK